jgi:hypothetical protein
MHTIDPMWESKRMQGHGGNTVSQLSSSFRKKLGKNVKSSQELSTIFYDLKERERESTHSWVLNPKP